MGNSLERLQLAINYLAKNVSACRLSDRVEILVTDWGSEVPLREVIYLNDSARKLTKFVEVSGELARHRQRDSPFPEVIALNAAARRAGGRYIGRIDQDTLVGRRFLRAFFRWIDGSETEVSKSLLFSQRRQIPFSFSSKHPSISDIESLLYWCGPLLSVDTCSPFFISPIGIMLLPADLWHECGGYDERLIHWGFMEVDIVQRLATRYPIIDIGPVAGYDFYHLEHYDPRSPRVTTRRTNPWVASSLAFHPNDTDWGLANESDVQVTAAPAAVRASSMTRSQRHRWTMRSLILQLFFLRVAGLLKRAVVALTQPSLYSDWLRRFGERFGFVFRRKNCAPFNR